MDYRIGGVITRRTTFAIFIIVALMFVNGSTMALAHRPVFSKSITLKEAIEIKDPQTSYTVYGEIKYEGEVDYIKFHTRKGEAICLEISVPCIKGNESFKPSFALIGKSFPNKEEQVPFSIPQGNGYLVFNAGIDYSKYYEYFTQTTYIRRQRIKMQAPAEGDYYIAVYSPEYCKGKYTIAIGERDKFQLVDILIFPYLWIRVKYWFNPARAVSIIIVLALVIMGIIYYIRKER